MFGKGEGGPREGVEEPGPREGTIAGGPRELIDNAGSGTGQLNALSNVLLHDLVEGVLTCCSSTGSDLKLHLFDGFIIIEILDWGRGNSLTSIGHPLFCHFCQLFCRGAVLISSLSMSG